MKSDNQLEDNISFLILDELLIPFDEILILLTNVDEVGIEMLHSASTSHYK